ncbi:F-box only protein 28 [Frankliniella fusca]|uniref:F-box only protein 28 n=1 Tax=Frankliniella fusca TaxID=407009 RepID=A0AAE1GS42_9NEOP|nr:F-box only protein 28 [Frankliniella fusca]
MVSTRQSSNGGGGDNNESNHSNVTWSRSRSTGANTSSEGLSSLSISNVASAGHHGSVNSLESVQSICSSSSSSGVSSASSVIVEPLNLLDMPPEILEKIFSYLGYHKVSQLRLVCKQLDAVCCNILNSTFHRLQNMMLSRFQAIRAKMPRRESARRHHHLALESDIVETLHMRLTLLQMTFGKHIERKHCCFFAGEILDEVFRILLYLKNTPKLSRPYKVTDELFDLSTMAMEYFKEHIEPTLPEISCFGTDFLDFSGSFSRKDDNSLVPYAMVPSPEMDNFLEPVPQSNMVLRKRIRKIKQGMRRYNNQLGALKREIRTCKTKIGDQQKLLLEYANRLDENDKKSEETSRKFSTLLQELNKCKTELQFWRSKAPATAPHCQNCGSAIPVVPGEDLKALANQGVLDGLLASPAPIDSGDPFHGLWAGLEDACCNSTATGSALPSASGQGSTPGSHSESPLPETSSAVMLSHVSITSSNPSVNSATPSTSSASSAVSLSSSGTSDIQESSQSARVGVKRKSSPAGQFAIATKVRRAAHLKSRASKRANKV